MANEGSTKPTVNGFCEKHQPNQAVQYAGCWVCSRDEETEMLREVLRAFGWMKDKEAGWYLAADGDDCPKFYDFHDAIAAALDDYDALREAHKKAHLYGAGQKVRADKLAAYQDEFLPAERKRREAAEAENLRVRGLLQRQSDALQLCAKALRMFAPIRRRQAMNEADEAAINALFAVESLPKGAESADIGKLDRVDESGKVNRGNDHE